MPVYTVHEPPRKEDDRDDDAIAHGARFVFVRDGFHFWAFLLAPLWMLRHRMWLELIAYLLLLAGITFGLQAARRRRERRLRGRRCCWRCWSAWRRRACGAGSSRAAALPASASWSATTSRTPSGASSTAGPRGTPAGARDAFAAIAVFGSSSSEIVGLFPQPEARP